MLADTASFKFNPIILYSQKQFTAPDSSSAGNQVLRVIADLCIGIA